MHSNLLTLFYVSLLLLASHLTIRSCLSSNALSVLFSVCISPCLRFSRRHLRPRSTDYSRCTSCGFNLLTPCPGVVKSLRLLSSGQVTILFLSYSTNLLLDSNTHSECSITNFNKQEEIFASTSDFLRVVLKK